MAVITGRIDAEEVVRLALWAGGPRTVVVSHGLRGCAPDCSHIITADVESIRYYVKFARGRNRDRGYGSGGAVNVGYGNMLDDPAELQ